MVPWEGPVAPVSGTMEAIQGSACVNNATLRPEPHSGVYKGCQLLHGFTFKFGFQVLSLCEFGFQFSSDLFISLCNS